MAKPKCKKRKQSNVQMQKRREQKKLSMRQARQKLKENPILFEKSKKKRARNFKICIRKRFNRKIVIKCT